MMNKEEKIGMYTSNEIYEELANGFLQRSMVDAMYFKIKDLQQRITRAIEYINHFSKKSEVKINGLPDCKVFIGDIEQLLEILGDKNE